MICHYRGVSTQLSPPNHPSYPLSHPPPPTSPSRSPPKLHSSPPKTPPAFLRRLRFHSAPSAPPFLNSTLRENVPLWERHSTLSALCGCAMCAYAAVCVYTILMCASTCLSKAGAVCIDTSGEPDGAESSLVENVWIGPGCGPETQNPRRQAKHRGLSQVYYICQQRSFFTTGQRSHSSTECSFLWDVRVCVWDPQPLAYPLSTRLPQVVLWRGGSVWLHHILTSPQTPFCYHVPYHHPPDGLSLPLCIPNGRRTGSCVSLTLSQGDNMFRVLTEALLDTWH